MKQVTGLILILLYFMLASFPSQAQHPHPAFREYTVEDGLPSSEVYQVKQDSKGYIWFATGNGVSRFNGYEFENFSIKDGLPDNTVFEIFEDKAERIWFVPISCKLSYYHKGKIHEFPYNDALQKLLNNPVKTSFAVDNKGTVYLGVYRDGIYEISSGGRITHHFAIEHTEPGIDIIQPEPGCLLCSNNSKEASHLIRFNTPWIKGTAIVPGDINETTASLRVLRTKNNLTLLSIMNKVYIFKTVTDYSVKTFPKRVIWLYEDADSDIWVGTYLGGVYHIHKGNFDSAAVYLPGLPVNGVIEDHNGGHWFATEGNGVFYAISKKVMVYDEAIGVAGNKINCLAASGTSVFAGTQEGIVHQVSDSIEHSYNTCWGEGRNNNINAFYYDAFRERLIVSSGTGCGYIQNNHFIRDATYGTFNRIVADDAQDLWIANAVSLDKYHEKKRVFISAIETQQLKRFNALLKEKNGNLLIGTIDGLWEFSPAGKTFSHCGRENSLLRSRILDLAYLDESRLVIATKGKGVLVYDNDTVYCINSKTGLCGDNVYRIFTNGPEIWAATNRGINCITVTKKDSLEYSIKKYTSLEGLSSNEINDILLLNGTIWAATNKGINVFSRQLEETKKHIPLYIDKICINDAPLSLSGSYLLEHDENNVTISFTALDYENAGKLRYMYRMHGLDTAWVTTQSREIRFTTLPPGNYRLELWVLDPGGSFSQDVSITINIKDPFWLEWWFVLLILLIITLILFLLFRLRLKHIRKRIFQSAELNRALLNLRMKALRAQMNPHFTFNVLNSIQHFILHHDHEGAQRYLSKFSRLLRAILNNSENNTILLAEELKALELYMELEAMRFENNFIYEITVDKSVDPLSIWIPSMLIQPYVENAIKHGILPSEKSGKISIGVTMQGSILKCTVEDNGIGRKNAAAQRNISPHKSMGSSITKERLIVINTLNSSNLSESILDLTDEYGDPAGTKVEIYIPLS